MHSLHHLLVFLLALCQFQTVVTLTTTCSTDTLFNIVGDDNQGYASSHQPGMRRRSSSLSPGDSRLWPASKITYRFYDAASSNALAATVTAAIAGWVAVAPYLKFVKAANSPTFDDGILTIYQVMPYYCSSTTARQQGWAAMGLSPSCSEISPVHLFGHVLGLQHEHQRPDRDTYVTVDCWATTIWCGAFDINHVTDSNGPYDINSVMHWSAHAFGRTSKTPLNGKAGVTVNQIYPTKPSLGDAKRVCELYGKNC